MHDEAIGYSSDARIGTNSRNSDNRASLSSSVDANAIGNSPAMDVDNKA